MASITSYSDPPSMNQMPCASRVVVTGSSATLGPSATADIPELLTETV